MQVPFPPPVGAGKDQLPLPRGEGWGEGWGHSGAAVNERVRLTAGRIVIEQPA